VSVSCKIYYDLLVDILDARDKKLERWDQDISAPPICGYELI
jgi:hypothetical protein